MKISAYLIRSSDKALYIRPKNTGDGVWIPKSQITYTKKFAQDAKGDVRLHLTIEGWLFKKRPELNNFPEGHIFI